MVRKFCAGLSAWCPLILFLCLPHATPAQAEVQLFGPLVYASMDEDSPDPESYRTALFAENAEGRRELLQALGLGKIPEIASAWKVFLTAHPEKVEEALLAQFASGSILDAPLAPGSRQVALHLGFDDDTDHPFGMVVLFDHRNGGWRHIATFACSCSLGNSIDPLDDPRRHPASVHDLVIGFPMRDSIEGRGSSMREVHFRMKDGKLWPLIDFERWRERCPQGNVHGPACTVWAAYLEKEMLIDHQGTVVPGFALVTMSGHPGCEMCALIMRNPTCAAYLWDDAQFRYVPSGMLPVKCGQVLDNRPANKTNAKPNMH